MKDIITILVLIAGIILVIAGKKTPLNKYAKPIGIILIVIFLGLAMPEFIKGVMDGFNAGYTAYNF